MDLTATISPHPEEPLPAGSPQPEEQEEEQAGRRREYNGDSDLDSDSSSLSEKVEIVKDGVPAEQILSDDNYDLDADYSENMGYEDFGTFNGYGDSSSETEDDYYNNGVEMDGGIPAIDLVDDEDDKFGFKPVLDLSDEGCEKEMRAHILGALMANGLQIRDGLTVQEINMNLGVATDKQMGFFARSLMNYTGDDQQDIDTNSVNEFLMMSKFEDVIKYDLQKNRFTPVLEPNSTLEKLAAEIYRMACKRNQRDEAHERKKTDTMDIPANRFRYMAASNMLVHILVKISERDCFNLGDKISWDKVRDYYEKDICSQKNCVYDQYNELLGLDTAGAKLNSKSVKAIFGRAKVKDFLKHPIYSKIKSCHGNQMMLSLDPNQYNNSECYYSQKDFADVQAIIDADAEETKFKEHHFEKRDKTERAEKEKEERMKNFVGIPEQTVFVPQMGKREVAHNLFGGPKMQQPEEKPQRVKEDYIAAEEEEQQRQEREDEDDIVSDAESDEASSYGDKPKERKQFFTDSEESDDEDDVQQRIRNEKKLGKPLAKKPAPKMTGLFTSAMKSNTRAVAEAQGGWETPTVSAPFVDQNTTVNTPAEPVAPLRLELIEVESDAAKKARMEEFAKQSSVDAEKPPLQTQPMSPSPESAISANEYDDCPFVISYTDAKEPIFKRPQMPNEKHHLHVEKKEKEHEQKLKEKERERLKREQEEKSRKIAELARQEKEREERMAAEARRPPPQQRSTFGAGFGPQKASFGNSVFNVPAPGKAPPSVPASAPSPAPGKGLFTARANSTGQNPMQQRPESRSFNQGSAFTSPPSSQSKPNYPQKPQMGQQDWKHSEQHQHQWQKPPNHQNYGQGPAYPQHGPSNPQNYDQRQSYQQPAPPKPQNYDQGPSYHQNGSPNSQNYGHGAPYQQQPYAQSPGNDFDRQWSQPNQQNFQQGYQSPPRMQHNQYGNPEYNNESKFGPDINPPEPRIGSTSYQPTFGTANAGCQTEPIDVLLAELMDNCSLNGIQDPSRMSNEDLFLHFVITHVYVYRSEDHTARRIWKTMKSTLPEPLNQPEMIFGRDWVEEVQRLLHGKVCITLTKTKNLLFEWNGGEPSDNL